MLRVIGIRDFQRIEEATNGAAVFAFVASLNSLESCLSQLSRRFVKERGIAWCSGSVS